MTGVRSLEWLILTRHGESTANVAYAAAHDGLEEIDVPERDADVPLSPAGQKQAAALGRRLAGLPPDERPTAVLASPYTRALETARIALAELPDTPVLQIDERLRDRELGVLDRLTPAGVRARFPAEAARLARLGKFYHRPPGGESWADMALRLRSAYRDLDLDHPGGRVLVVAHDAVVVLTRYIVENRTEQEIMEIEKTPIVNCSISRWRRRGGRLAPVEYNDPSHLPDPLIMAEED
ncbi:histidine phosphatase family protein [Actinomadura craniellae]|uniref:Histidine phosphatase family protein n=1 Tax=Actinomadura craniellae TaxID=2231787 RepID=A0A365HC38_9ACTN|nr:histidine phosphatase family protein [Actinomadura craniellae]RAY16657.1 histidine phosphatase family protein [Actinomadura craniellae]